MKPKIWIAIIAIVLVMILVLSAMFIMWMNNKTYHEEKINYFLNEVKIINIDIKDYGFFPKIININAGEVVLWKNTGTKNHGITFDNYNETGSDILGPGKNFTKVFIDEGIYDYHCSVYPYLIGKIIVKE